MSAPTWRKKVRYIQAEPGFWAAGVGEHLAGPELVSRLGLPDEAVNWKIERLSTGEKQRVALARGLEDAPEVLLLDEPTSGLDETAAGAVEDLIKEHLAAGAHVLVVSHDRAQARRLASRALVIADGAVGEGRP